MMKIKSLALKIFWGITGLKFSIIAYLLITSEQVRNFTSAMLRYHAMKPVIKLTSDELDIMADRTFEGLDPRVKDLQDATSATRMSQDIMAEIMADMESFHYVAPIAFLEAMIIFLIGMLKARKTAVLLTSLSVYGKFLILGDEIDSVNWLDVLLPYMPGMLQSRIAAITMTTLAVGISLYGMRTPFGKFNIYGDDFVLYVLDRAYFSDSEMSLVNNPISHPTIIAINAAYILSIFVIFAADVWCNLHFQKIVSLVTYLIFKLKPIQATKDNRFENFATTCRAGQGKYVLRTLLEDKSFNLNQRDLSSGNTGLHMACISQNLNIVQALLDNRQARRINLSIENNNGKTPLMIAAGTGNRNIVRHLIKQPKLKLKGYNGDGAIVDAVKADYFSVALSVAEEIVKRGLCLRDCSKYLKDATLLETLRRCASLERREGKKMSEEGRKQSLQIYKTNILKSLHEVPSEGAVEDKLTQERIHEELKEFLECSICFEEYGEGPILACRNDHWICSTCYPRNATCAWCREDIQRETPRRCRTSEKILKLIAVLELPKKRS